VLIDSFHRRITYLRLSVTDRCNLRCRYCMPEHGVKKLGHEDILTYEEFTRVVEAAASEGMTKIRLTGGEPLVRKGFLNFVHTLSSIPGTLDLRLTTNGVLLADMAGDLLTAGVRRVNVSLDSLDRSNFFRITGRDYLETVWRGVETALAVGFDRVKINVVVIRGFNDHEIIDFARLTLDRPLEVRFIEFMPIGREDFWSPHRLVSIQEIKDRLGLLGDLVPTATDSRDGPAAVFHLTGAEGRVGFISPVTDHFCQTCNRLRLTADGKLKPCLLSNREIDLKTPLRSNATRKLIAEILHRAVKNKPGRHHLDRAHHSGSNRTMNLIGG